MEEGGKKNRKRRTGHTRRWRFACGSRFYATRFWHCDFTVMREHARANGSIFFLATYFSFSLHSLAHSALIFFLPSNVVQSQYFCILLFRYFCFYNVLLYSLESEFVSSFNSSFPEQTVSFAFFFLYLLAYTFVYFVLSTMFSFLVPFSLFSIVSFVPAVPFM